MYNITAYVQSQEFTPILKNLHEHACGACVIFYVCDVCENYFGSVQLKKRVFEYGFSANILMKIQTQFGF